MLEMETHMGKRKARSDLLWRYFLCLLSDVKILVMLQVPLKVYLFQDGGDSAMLRILSLLNAP